MSVVRWAELLLLGVEGCFPIVHVLRRFVPLLRTSCSLRQR
jgi:hypothetical protein